MPNMKSLPQNPKALDVLPYHDMGKSKYEEMGIEYPLRDTKPLEKQDAIKAKNIILKGIEKSRKKNTES